ncbi:MAG: hypothetical protein J7K73_01535 [Nanoarchaeota archaeon]|nr:hypothetical protein [Nanoarchaeota archaeon]
MVWLAPEWFTRKKWRLEREVDAYFDLLGDPTHFTRISTRCGKRYDLLLAKLERIYRIASRREWR